MTDENTAQQNPEGMVEDVKEPQETGVAATPGEPDQQGKILTITNFILVPSTDIVSKLLLLSVTAKRCLRPLLSMHFLFGLMIFVCLSRVLQEGKL